MIGGAPCTPDNRYYGPLPRSNSAGLPREDGGITTVTWMVCANPVAVVRIVAPGITHITRITRIAGIDHVTKYQVPSTKFNATSVVAHPPRVPVADVPPHLSNRMPNDRGSVVRIEHVFLLYAQSKVLQHSL